jgi:hypothetical protein
MGLLYGISLTSDIFDFRISLNQTDPMKAALFLRRLFLLALPLVVLANSKADILIDSFSTPQSAPGGIDTRNVADGSGIIGGERDILSYLTLSANGTVANQLLVAYPNGSLTGRAGADITYDGPDHDPSSSYFGGLGSVDLTQEGVNDRLRFDITSIANTSATLLITLRSPYHGSSVQLNLPQNPGILDVPFAWFQQENFMPYPVDFHNVGYIDFHFVMNSGDAVVMDSVMATVPEPTALTLISCLSIGFLIMRRKRIG